MRYTAWLPNDEDDAFAVPLREALDARVLLVAQAAPPEGVVVDGLIHGVPTEAQLAACPALRHVFIPYAGLPPATAERLRARPEVAVHNLHHNAVSTAELAMALLLAAAKLIVPHDRDLREGDWRRRYGEPRTATLAGGHAVVLGYGAVGRRVARACSALGMRVTGVRRRAPTSEGDGAVRVVAQDAFPRVVSDADALIVCLPLTATTAGLVDAAALALLPPRAYVVNVGRGPLIAEAALYEALASGRLAGAGLDVWYRYPKAEAERASTPPSAYPFHELENVVLSPHRAGLTRQNEAARAQALAALLRAAAAGEDVPHRVDLEQGY